MVTWIIFNFEANFTLGSEGDIEQTFSPCSTFKVPLALMGYDAGILTNTTTPKWNYNDEFQKDIPIMFDQWKQAHDPNLWMKNSCVWYSQEITRRLGPQKLSMYIDKFDYGNRNILGDAGKNNGLVRSWLTSSLQISPLQQVEFIKKILNYNLPVSSNAFQFISNLIQDDEISLNGRVFAKTGSGFIDRENDLQKGWYIGWLEKNNQKTIFACLREHTGPGFGGLEARKFMLSKVLSQI